MPMLGMTFNSYQNGHFDPMGMRWEHFIPIGMSKAFHSGQNGLFIPVGIKWIDFIFIGMKWVHFIPNRMDNNVAFHSDWNDQFNKSITTSDYLTSLAELGQVYFAFCSGNFFLSLKFVTLTKFEFNNKLIAHNQVYQLSRIAKLSPSPS